MPEFVPPAPVVRESITVEMLLRSEQLRLPLRSFTPGIGLRNLISDKNIHRPQLALAGYVELFTHHRVQVVGNTEMYYLQSLSPSEAEKAFERITQFPIPCLVLTNGHTFPETFLQIATQRGIPILGTEAETTKALYHLGEFLDMQFSPRATVHGSFVDVYGVGMLIIGKSGIGKSEIALELVERGQRLVSDDVVLLLRRGENIVFGTGLGVTRHFMEIRGLGLIDVRHMFGVRSIRAHKRLEIIVQLEEWSQQEEYTRTGLDKETVKVLDTDIRFLRLPIFPGKNVAVIAEAIALDFLSAMYGHDASSELALQVRQAIKRKTMLKQLGRTDAEAEWDDLDPSLYFDIE